MAGLDQLQTMNYQANLPEEAKWGMQGLNALWAARQQKNQEQAQSNVLQNQQNQLQVSGLEGAVAQAQNTPEGVSTLAGGEQGMAQSRATKGKLDQAELPSKINQAQIDATFSAFEQAEQEIQANPNLGLGAITNPKVKEAVIGHMKKTNFNLQDSLNDITNGLTTLKNKKLEMESLAKGAASIANTQTLANSRETAATTRANATLEVAKLKEAGVASKQALAATDTPKALDSAFLREVSKINAARAKAISDNTMTPELEQALNNQELSLRRDYENIRNKYKAASSAASVNTPKVIQYDSKGNRVQ